MGTTANQTDMVFIRGGLCQLLTDHLFFVMIYNFVQKCIKLAKNNVMSVLTPI